MLGGQNGAATICSFHDGSVGVYDLRKEQWDFLTEEAHTETIFDCVFKPGNCDQLATVSYDGSIKLWDLRTMKVISSVKCNGVLYCASWAPGDEDRIVACSSDGAVFVVECAPGRGKVLHSVQAHQHGKPSFRCAWNTVNRELAISTASDRNAVIINVDDGVIVKRFTHPASVFGCDWHKVNGLLFVTGCQDAVVRVFDRTQNAPLMALRGHDAKVFNTVWSSLQPQMLMSGSDDCNIHVWNTDTRTSVVLRGHTQNVRALIWHSEIPWMVVTGSWDSTIRVWDVRSQQCLRIVADHHADVYGLGSHPERPFLFVSSSRDNTIRQWRLDDMVVQMTVQILIDPRGVREAFRRLLGSVSEAIAADAPMMLAGPVSREISQRLERCGDEISARQLVCTFLQSPPDVSEVWNLTQTIITGKTFSVQNRIVHGKDLLRSVQGRAQQLEGARVAKFTGVGGARKEDQLKDAAKTYLRLGQIERHCEILVELGQWEKALAVAPGAGLGYWQALSLRYADHLDGLNKFEEAVPYLAATKSVDRLMESEVAHGNLEDAFVVARAACEGYFDALDVDSSATVDTDPDAALSRLHSVGRLLAQRHGSLGRPVLAAACYLAVDDTMMAIKALYLGNELVLAAALADSLAIQGVLVDAVYDALAQSLEGLGHWELAIKVLRKQTPEVARRSVELCAARYVSPLHVSSCPWAAGADLGCASVRQVPGGRACWGVVGRRVLCAS